MAEESFFADPSFEGINLVTAEGADRVSVAEAAAALLEQRLGLRSTSVPVGPDGDGSPGDEVDLLVDVVDSPNAAAVWDLTYELADLPGVADVEPLWELSQDEFAVEVAETDRDGAGAEVLTRIGFDGSAAGPAPATRGIFGDDDLPSDLNWSARMVNAPAAWALPPQAGGAARGRGVLVGHPDSGFITHHELRNPAEPNDRFLEHRGFDFIDQGSLQSPDGGHGTGTASVLMSWDGPGAQPTGQVDLMGVAPEAELIPYRVTRKHGIVPSPVLFRSGARRLRDAIYKATADGCHVISISLGWMKLRSLHRAIQFAVERDVIVLAAAGNYVWRVVWPARYPEVIAVAGCTYEGKKWVGSSRGSAVDITAPAKDVWRASFQQGVQGIAPGRGTSFAVASVAGIAALWIAHHGRAALLDRYRGVVPLSAVFNHVLARSASAGPIDHGGRFGAGIANAAVALQVPLPEPNEVGATRRTRSVGMVAPLDAELDLDGSDDRARHALALGLEPSALDTDLDDLSDELFFHVFTDPVRREAALGPDSSAPGEFRHGTTPTGPTVRRGGATPAGVDRLEQPVFSKRLADRLNHP